MKRNDLHSVGSSLAAAALFGMVGFACVMGVSKSAVAQEYPTKPVRLVIPNAVGSATDLLARVIGQGMSKHLGQPFIVDPRPGGSAVIGTDYVARQVPADGYTLLVAAHTILVFPLFTKDPTSDPARDLVLITLLGETGFSLAAHASMPFSSFSEFIGYAKANPGKLNFATGGPQSSITLVLELIKQRGGVDMANIPYQGSGQIYAALLANTVQVSAGITTGQAATAVKEGRLKALAVSGDLPPVAGLAEGRYFFGSAAK
ncbi:MAG: tripartite tricarboxylate transporter substrate binding protein [Betaproteobacteria bacterium]|nr:tripartite tricarboxylate transporter substrate binding protein [Betaproteobacteria bacterium]